MSRQTATVRNEFPSPVRFSRSLCTPRELINRQHLCQRMQLTSPVVPVRTYREKDHVDPPGCEWLFAS
jgi:hypothetical protein